MSSYFSIVNRKQDEGRSVCLHVITFINYGFSKSLPFLFRYFSNKKNVVKFGNIGDIKNSWYDSI